MHQPDKLTVVLGLPAALALFLPAFTFRANRIAAGEARSLVDVFGPGPAAAIVAVVLGSLILLLFLRRPDLRCLLTACILAAALWLLGAGASSLGETASSPAARISPGAGFWLFAACLALLLVDALARLRPGPLLQLALLGGGIGLVAIAVASGIFTDLSIAAEFRNRQSSFWRAAIEHLQLAGGSFLGACIIGLPIGLLIYRFSKPRAAVLNVLTLIQTIPSIALFGMLIAPLGWIAANLPGAQAIGIRGIGMAPAMLALFLYALLPIVANTVAGLASVSPSVSEAARGMGLTRAQQMRMVKLPLALPVILTGARIVLVQNIGLATVGALIGAGGFGTFVFQGIGQTATDLILLGVLPTVVLAFVASALLDIIIALLPGPKA